MSEEFYRVVYYASTSVYAALIALGVAFYLREYVRATKALRARYENRDAEFYDELASREVATTALLILSCFAGCGILMFAIVPPHTAELTLRALLGRLMLLLAVGFLLRGYARWQGFRDHEVRKRAVNERKRKLADSIAEIDEPPYPGKPE